MDSLRLQSYTLSKVKKRIAIFARERLQFILRPATQNRRAYVGQANDKYPLDKDTV